MNHFLRFLKITVGLVLGLGLCVALVWRLGVSQEDVLRLVSGVSGLHVAIVFLLTALLAWSGARKWALWSEALCAAGQKTECESAPPYLRHMIWQSWLGQFVPPSLAVILGRGMAEKKETSFRSGAISGTLDQAMEFLFLAALLPAGIAVLWFHKGFAEFLGLTALGWFLAATTTYVVARQVRPAWCFYLVRLMGWSMLRVALTVLRLVWGAPALGLSIDLLAIAAASPVVALLALIPLTPGNLGLAEWGWVGALAFAGTNPLEAGLLALGFRLLVLVAQTLLLGGYEAYVSFTKART